MSGEHKDEINHSAKLSLFIAETGLAFMIFVTSNLCWNFQWLLREEINEKTKTKKGLLLDISSLIWFHWSTINNKCHQIIKFFEFIIEEYTDTCLFAA